MLRFCHPFLIFQPRHAPCHVDNSGSPFCSISYIDTFTHISQPLHRLFISVSNTFPMRCDLHVHTKASGMCNTAFVRHFVVSLTTTPKPSTTAANASAC